MSPLPAGPTSIPVPSLALIILDGWGLAPDGPGNAVSQAATPVFDELWARYPHTTLSACGRDVGLPDGQMGNSEVGHLNLGAGSIVKQDLTRIDDAIADGSFFENPALKDACEAARSGPRGRLHLMGLVSDGGVHSGWEHIEACVELAAREGGPDLVVHAFTDGRDTLPTAGGGVNPPPRIPETTLAEVIAQRGERQLHVAETEKYAHVTYFFNGGRETEWKGEERCLIPSIRDVPTYDHRPEMRAREAAAGFSARWRADRYRFGTVNFDN